MQYKPFVTEPRKELLSIGQYHLLMSWAYNCSWHVLPSFGKDREALERELVLTVRRIKKTSYNDYQEII